jgi:hypothetical protein
MSLALITPPTEEPVTLDEALAFSRIDEGVDDRLVQSLILAARRYIEGPILNRSLLTQTWDWTFDMFSCSTFNAFPYVAVGSLPFQAAWNPYTALLVPRPPLQSVTSITYVDMNGATQTIDPATYVVDVATEPGRINLAYGRSWPTTRSQPNAITVRFVAGWQTVEAIPEEIKQAIKIQVSTLYENRENLLVGQTVNELPLLSRLLAEHRIYGLA